MEDVLPYAMLGMVCKDACAVKATHVVVAFDGPRNFRYKLYPEYKSNRAKGEVHVDVDDDMLDNTDGVEDTHKKDIYEYLPDVFKYLEAAGICVVRPPEHEADDMLASVAVQYSPKCYVALGARDKDLDQTLVKNVSKFDSCSDPSVWVTGKDIVKSKGLPIESLVSYQTLIGDSIDNIPSLKSPAAAKKILKQWGTITNWYKNASAEDKVWLKTKQTALALNKKLVQLFTGLQIPELEEMRMPKLNLRDMPKGWYAYQLFCYPKSKGLFKR